MLWDEWKGERVIMKTEEQMKGVFYVQLSTLFARDKK